MGDVMSFALSRAAAAATGFYRRVAHWRFDGLGIIRARARLRASATQLRDVAAGLAIFAASALLPLPALAQSYATLTSGMGNPPNVVTTPDGTFGLYDKGYAGRAARYLNQMAEASNNCDLNGYESARKAFLQLIEAAQANYNNAHAHYVTLHDQAVAYWAHSSTFVSRISYALTFGAYDSITQLPEPLRSRLSAAEKAQAMALSDLNALRNVRLPNYNCKGSLLSSDILGTEFTYGNFESFVGGYFGGGFQSTNFSVSDTGFNVNGSGFLGGGFGGVLLPIPNTSALAGIRIGGQGSNITGSITSPAASPASTYKVQENWTAYEEAEVKINLLFNAVDAKVGRQFYSAGSQYDLWLSAGVAESGTSVKGTSGTFSDADNAVRTGITFSVGASTPVATLPNGIVDLFAQYRATQWVSTVNIPGPVPIGSFTNEVDLGLQFRFWGHPAPH
jgi:hypothetical protein